MKKTNLVLFVLRGLGRFKNLLSESKLLQVASFASLLQPQKATISAAFTVDLAAQLKSALAIRKTSRVNVDELLDFFKHFKTQEVGLEHLMNSARVQALNLQKILDRFWFNAVDEDSHGGEAKVDVDLGSDHEDLLVLAKTLEDNVSGDVAERKVGVAASSSETSMKSVGFFHSGRKNEDEGVEALQIPSGGRRLGHVQNVAELVDVIFEDEEVVDASIRVEVVSILDATKERLVKLQRLQDFARVLGNLLGTRVSLEEGEDVGRRQAFHNVL